MNSAQASQWAWLRIYCVSWTREWVREWYQLGLTRCSRAGSNPGLWRRSSCHEAVHGRPPFGGSASYGKAARKVALPKTSRTPLAGTLQGPCQAQLQRGWGGRRPGHDSGSCRDVEPSTLAVVSVVRLAGRGDWRRGWTACPWPVRTKIREKL